MTRSDGPALPDGSRCNASHPPRPDDHAIRASLLHAVANTSDQHTHSIDPPLWPQTTPEHVTALAASLGDVARCEHSRELQDALVVHAALALAWLEFLVREEQAA